MKYSGKIGFVETVETSPGIWEDVETEKQCYGDVLQAGKRPEPSQDTTNMNLKVNNRISIVMNPFIQTHFHSIRYLHWQGSTWEITSTEVQYPRLILSLGGLWHK